MEVVTGALPSAIAKLGDLLLGEYNLQKGVKGEIRFLQSELESMQGALEKVSNTPVDHLDIQDKIWARNLRELSYDIQDSIETFMVRCKGDESTQLHGISKFIDRSVGLFRKAKIRHGIATEIRDIKNRVEEVSKRHDRYKVSSDVAKPVTIDPRLFLQYDRVTDLVGIDEAIEEVIQILMEGDEVSKQHDKVVSIVGFGGLGKTTLANVVYGKLGAQFECSAFVSVSRAPDMEKLLKDLLHQLGKISSASTNVVGEVREFLQKKRYIIVIDDIWDISVWKMIKCALPDNNVGCKVIATTRIINIAEQCGDVYKLKPLSQNSSRKLLYRRIFGSENTGNSENTKKYPDEDLVEVSDKILQKCAGIPLAIITIASLLASKGRNIMDWYQVYKSIGTGLGNSLDVENMRKILILSYYDLPSILKTCLLYLSVFPEDYTIEKDRLIWMWIAEGFIQCKDQRESLSELGESYFNELTNRSMIQLVNHKHDTESEYFRVHDMVLDLIHFLLSEENFVTIVNDDMDHTSPSITIRRLSVHYADHAAIPADINKKKIRSVVVFSSSAIDLKLDLGSFRVLRVLDLKGCSISNPQILKYLGKLIHLRFLGLRGAFIQQLPEEIGNLRYLQTLDTRNTMTTIGSFPLAVFHLKHLRCLHIQSFDGVPKGIRNLTSLEVLTLMWICDHRSIIELGHLTELRVLNIMLHTGSTDGLEKSLAETLLESLHKLNKIQSVVIGTTVLLGSVGRFDAWRPPPHLHRINLDRCWFSARPDWMNPSHLMHLTFLRVGMEELQQEDLEILGRLPALRDLSLWVNHEELGIRRRLAVGASLFPILARCKLGSFMPPVVFRQGAMPRLTDLEFTFPVRQTREHEGGSIGGFDLGLENLTSLQNVVVRFRSKGDSEEDKEEAHAALRHAAEIHPNRPTLQDWGR